MMYWRKNSRSKPSEIRYAVVNTVHQEVLSQNHKVIGEAFNSMNEDYNSNRGLVVVATQDDVILGEVRRNGKLKNNGIKLPKTIWDAPRNVFFNPELAKKITESAQKFLNEILQNEDIKIFTDTDCPCYDNTLEENNVQ